MWSILHIFGGYQLVTENAIEGFFEHFSQCLLADYKVEGKPPRIWEVSSDWSSYRNGMYRSIEQALVGRETADTKNACKGGYKATGFTNRL